MSQLLLDCKTTAEPRADVLAPEVCEAPSLAAAQTVAAPHDRLAVGMFALLALTVVQRCVGLGRNILFCRMLGPEDLGRWNLAFSFLMLAAPLVVWSLPGVFGRYVEYYRQRGQLRMFLRRTALATGLLTTLGALAIVVAPQWFAGIVFRDPAQQRIMLLLGGLLATVVAYNYLTELFTALRRARVASWMHFVHSVVFAAAGATLLSTTSWSTTAVAIAYVAACFAAFAVAIPALRASWQAAPALDTPLPQAEFWSKLLPLIGWVGAMNLLQNVTDVADRYLLLYFAAGDAADAAALVGQYHSSRVAPELLASLATMLAGVLLPYNSHDWEAGRRDQVVMRLNLALKAMGILLTLAGAAILAASPLLFVVLLHGEYSLGQAVLPWTLLLCIWLGLTILALNYLWCAERARLAAAVLAAGLVCNVALNALAVPLWGLTGAVVATALANGLTLVIALACNAQVGMKIDRGVWLASAAPLTLLLGVAPALGAVGVVVLSVVGTNWLFDREEKTRFLAALQSMCTALRPQA